MSEVETMRLPLLALRGLIVFPGMIINLDVGRDRSIKAVETAMATTKRILLVTQKAAEEADPTAQDLYGFGVVAEIKQMLKMPNGAMRILVEGLYRVEVISVIDEVGMNLEAHVEVKEDTDNRGNEVEALKRMLVETFEQWVLASKKVTSEVMLTFKDQPDAGRVADMIGGYLTIDVPERKNSSKPSVSRSGCTFCIPICVRNWKSLPLKRTFPSRSVSRSNRISVNIICENR